MANMLYNGVELPDINEVWTDKETYPYAAIAYWPEYGQATLSLTTKALVRISTGFFHLVDGGVSIYDFSAGGAWTLRNHYDYTTTSVFSANNAVWSNHDVFNNYDNALFLAASDPVDPNAPTFDTTTFLSGLTMGLCGKGTPGFDATDTFGKGYLLGCELRNKRPTAEPVASMYLYGTPSDSGNIGLRSGESVSYYDGAVLPPLPELPNYLLPPYSDKVFPYRYISLWKDEGVTYVFLTATTTPPYFTGSVYTPTTNGYYASATLKYAPYSGSWAEYEKLEQYGELLWDWDIHGEYDAPMADENEETAIWSNFDLLNEDGTVHLAASDPVPVYE